MFGGWAFVMQCQDKLALGFFLFDQISQLWTKYGMGFQQPRVKTLESTRVVSREGRRTHTWSIEKIVQGDINWSQPISPQRVLTWLDVGRHGIV